MMVKPGAIALLLTTATLAAGAWNIRSVDSLYDRDMDLSPGTTTTDTSDTVDDLRLLPQSEELSARILDHVDALDERILVESVRQIAIDEDKRVDPTEEEHLIATLLRAVGSMEGIEYYSERRGRYRTLFERSTRIDDPDSRQPINDSTVESIPEREELYVLQEDSTFGENVYHFEYERLNEGLLLVMTNETRLSWGMLPAVGADNLRLIFAAIPTTDGILFYGLAGVEIRTILGMGERVSISFENRVNALSDWFEQGLFDALEDNV